MENQDSDWPGRVTCSPTAPRNSHPTQGMGRVTSLRNNGGAVSRRRAGAGPAKQQTPPILGFSEAADVLVPLTQGSSASPEAPLWRFHPQAQAKLFLFPGPAAYLHYPVCHLGIDLIVLTVHSPPVPKVPSFIYSASPKLLSSFCRPLRGPHTSQNQCPFGLQSLQPDLVSPNTAVISLLCPMTPVAPFCLKGELPTSQPGIRRSSRMTSSPACLCSRQIQPPCHVRSSHPCPPQSQETSCPLGSTQ